MVATAPTPTRVENCGPLPVPLRALDPTGKGPLAVTAAPGFLTSPNKTEKAQTGWHLQAPMTLAPLLCGKTTVAGGKCRNPVGACAAQHPGVRFYDNDDGGTWLGRDPGNRRQLPSADPLIVVDSGGAADDDGAEDDDSACRDCGEPADGGEGWDGLCGTCADREWAVEEADAVIDETLAAGGGWERFAADDDSRVRWRAAQRAGCPPAVLEALAADGDPEVRAAAAANPSCPPAARAAVGLLAR